MIDTVDKETRSRMMAAIKRKDTKPELALRRALHAMGLRYRLDVKGLPGRPDLLFPRFNAAVFVHGCFWHRHPDCRRISVPSTRQDYWQDKFSRNMVRDRNAVAGLTELRWRVAIVWECALRKPALVETTAAAVQAWLHSERTRLELGEDDVSQDDGQ